VIEIKRSRLNKIRSKNDSLRARAREGSFFQIVVFVLYKKKCFLFDILEEMGCELNSEHKGLKFEVFSGHIKVKLKENLRYSTLLKKQTKSLKTNDKYSNKKYDALKTKQNRKNQNKTKHDIIRHIMSIYTN